MWKTLLRTTDWSDVFDLISPSMFRILSPSTIARQAKQLARNWRDSQRFEALCDDLRVNLEASQIDIQLVTNRPEDAHFGAADGESVLELFFHQIFVGESTILDIRHDRMWVEDGRTYWSPRPYYLVWEEDFLTNLRRVYRGFYRRDSSEYDGAMTALGLEGLEDVFRDQFGGQDRQHVEFELADFRATFKEILSASRQRDTKLHPNFIALGIYLACLYEHLDELGGAYDVAAAVERARDVSV